MVSVYSAGVSIGCCVLVLLLSLWVWSVRSARGFLDRVSFRLLLWSMFFEIIYDVNYIAVVMSASPVSIPLGFHSVATAARNRQRVGMASLLRSRSQCNGTQ